MPCGAFDVSSSSYYEHGSREGKIDAQRVLLRSEVKRLFDESRGSAGTRSLVKMMREDDHKIGRFKVRKLMKEAGAPINTNWPRMNDQIYPIF